MAIEFSINVKPQTLLGNLMIAVSITAVLSILITLRFFIHDYLQYSAILVALFSVFGLYLARQVREQKTNLRVEMGSDGLWILRDYTMPKASQDSQVRLTSTSLRWRWLIILQFIDESSQKRKVVILRWSVNSEDFRRLSLALKRVAQRGKLGF